MVTIIIKNAPGRQSAQLKEGTLGRSAWEALQYHEDRRRSLIPVLYSVSLFFLAWRSPSDGRMWMFWSLGSSRRLPMLYRTSAYG